MSDHYLQNGLISLRKVRWVRQIELDRPYINYHYLSWKVLDFSNFFKQESCDSASSISLVCVMLDNKPLLQFWPMVFFMLIYEIRVNSMSHVCRHYKERTSRKIL